MTHLSLDHLHYLRNQTYRRRLNARLRRLIAEEPGKVSRLTVVHEHDDRCCRREPWRDTYVRLIAALHDDGERVLGVVLASRTPSQQQP